MKRFVSFLLSIVMLVTTLSFFDASVFAQIYDSIIANGVEVEEQIFNSLADCDHNYVVDSVTGTPTCSKKGFITYRCTICDKTNRVYSAYGHEYVAQEFNGRSIKYKCKYCSYEVTRMADYAMDLFDANLNKNISRGNDNCFADVVADGTINAKDYALLKNISQIKLSNPNANAQTLNIYKYLCSIDKKQTLSAQQESTWMGSADYEIDYVYKNTGKYPAMRGLDYMNDDFKGVNQRAIAYAQRGGLVTICWHTGSDFTGEWNDAMNDTVADWNKMLTEGTEEYKQMIAGMDKAASALKELQDAGVTVLWRPFHEFDGGWFWWGKNGAEPFKKMWEIMYKRYTDYWGLNNLIWVLGFSHNGVDIGNWKPDEQYYDIIGADSYDKEELPTLYNAVKAINVSGKPIALHECGSNPTVKELTDYPWCYFMTWHTNYITDENDKTELNTLYNSDRVITLDEVKY